MVSKYCKLTGDEHRFLNSLTLRCGREFRLVVYYQKFMTEFQKEESYIGMEAELCKKWWPSCVQNAISFAFFWAKEAGDNRFIRWARTHMGTLAKAVSQYAKALHPAVVGREVYLTYTKVAYRFFNVHSDYTKDEIERRAQKNRTYVSVLSRHVELPLSVVAAL